MIPTEENNMRNSSAKDIEVYRESIRNLINRYDLIIPPFQRKLVWNNAKKEQLIYSLIKKFPIGAITLYANDERQYYVVDGLQRINTIKDYITQPSAILSYKKYYELIESDIYDLCSKYSLKINLVKKGIGEWYKSLKESFEYEVFANLSSEIESATGVNLTISIFQELRDVVIKPINVVDNLIAIIEYYGTLDSLPELFAKTNQKSVSLTPYEILHSLWYKYILDKEYFKSTYFGYYIDLITSNTDFAIKPSIVRDFNIYMNFSAVGHHIWKSESTEIIQFLKNNNANFFQTIEVTFDILSTIATNRYNKPDTAVRKIDFTNTSVNEFIMNLNNAIVKSAHMANKLIFDHNDSNLIPKSRYHYDYIVYGYLLAEYKYCLSSLSIIRRERPVDRIINTISNLSNQIENSWFINEYRQVDFYAEKIEELVSFTLELND